MNTDYIKDIFLPDDRLAVFLKRGRHTEQHFVTSAKLINPEYQAWLKEQNSGGTNVYVSMNSLNPDSNGRTKSDIAEIRTIFLDIDENADTALEHILSDSDIPSPNYVLDTSPGKKQIVWKAKGFSSAAAECLQRNMVMIYDADPVVTDSSRVLRIPGYNNCKYDTPFMVTVKKLSDRIYTPEDFHVTEKIQDNPSCTTGKITIRTSGKDSQSERDWFAVCRRLERGESPDAVKNWLEASRQDKPKPQYYADRTVSRAVQYVSQLTYEQNKPKQENVMDNNEQNKQQKERYYIEGNGFSVRAELKELGCRFDPDKKKWYATDPTVVAEAERIISIETSAMDNAKEHETREPRHYIEGNSFAVKDQLKSMGCQYDADEKKWFHTNPEKAKEAQAIVPAKLEKHAIGEAPREMTDELKGMGCKWNKDAGWYHSDQKTAEQARARIQEVEPRHYLNGDGYAVKDQLKALECKWDGAQKQWYTTDPAKIAEAQAVIDNAPQRERRAKEQERHYLTGETMQLKDQLKEMGCRWGGEKKQWYHTDPAKAKEAQALIDNSRDGLGKDKAPKPGDPANGPKHGGDSVSRIAKELDRGM